jgi:glycosyltransferase involved in cell wall biosynthesis
MTRILHLLSADDWGGTEVQVAELLRRAADGPVRHDLAVLEPRGELHRQLADEGLEVHALGGGTPRAAMRLARVLRDGEWDVLEAYGFRAGIAARAALAVAGRRRPRLVMGVRGLHFAEAEDPDGARTRIVLTGERLLRWTVAAYDANSDGARRFLSGHGLPADRFTVIRNGVQPIAGVTAEAIAARAQRTPPVITCVARFVPRKQHDVLLRALAALRDRGLDAELRLIGHGPTETAIRALAIDLGVADRVRFEGRRSQQEVVAYLLETDVFVLCSLWEGMPGSVLEAMAAGIPVVATRVSGTDETVVDGETGLLVAPGDADALAGALQQVLQDPAARVRMGRAGLERVQRDFGFDRLVQEKNALFTRIAR